MNRRLVVEVALAVVLVAAIVLYISQSQTLTDAQITQTAQADTIAEQATEGAEDLADAGTQAAEDQEDALNAAATQAAEDREGALNAVATQAAEDQEDALNSAATQAAEDQEDALNSAATQAAEDQEDALNSAATQAAEDQEDALNAVATQAAEDQEDALNSAATQAAEDQEDALNSAATQAAEDQTEALDSQATESASSMNATATQAAEDHAESLDAAATDAWFMANATAIVKEATQQIEAGITATSIHTQSLATQEAIRATSRAIQAGILATSDSQIAALSTQNAVLSDIATQQAADFRPTMPPPPTLITPIPFPSATPILAMTATPLQPPTAVFTPSLTGAENFEPIIGGGITLALPDSFVGGDINTQLNNITSAMRAHSSGNFADAADQLERDAGSYLFYAFDTEHSGAVPTTVSVRLEAPQGEVDLEAYTDLTVSLYAGLGIVDSRIATTVRDIPATRLTITMGETRQLIYILNLNNLIFTITYTTDVQSFPVLLPMFESSIQTISFG